MTITLILIFSLLLLYLIIKYNSLIKRRNSINYALSSIDALFKKRYDLIPNLVSTVREYMKYEKEILERLTDMRIRAINGHLSLQEREKLETEIGKIIKSIFAVAENYPDLKSSQNFLQLQASLNEVEEQLSAARRALAGSIKEYNDLVQSFPSNLVAKLFGFKTTDWYRISEEERSKPDVKELFK